jgi:hypothetical protein
MLSSTWISLGLMFSSVLTPVTAKDGPYYVFSMYRLEGDKTLFEKRRDLKDGTLLNNNPEIKFSKTCPGVWNTVEGSRGMSEATSSIESFCDKQSTRER